MKSREVMKDRRKNKLTNRLIEFLKFYNINLKKKHIVCFVISLIIFAYVITTLLNNTTTDITEILNKNMESANNNFFDNFFQNKILITFLVVISGITPYVYIPLFGLFYPINLAVSIVSMSGFSVVWATLRSNNTNIC